MGLNLQVAEEVSSRSWLPTLSSWANASPTKCFLVSTSCCDGRSSLRWYSGIEAMAGFGCTVSGGGEFASTTRGSQDGSGFTSLPLLWCSRSDRVDSCGAAPLLTNLMTALPQDRTFACGCESSLSFVHVLVPHFTRRKELELRLRGVQHESIAWRSTRRQRGCCVSQSQKTSKLQSTFSEQFFPVFVGHLFKGRCLSAWVRKSSCVSCSEQRGGMAD